MFGLSAKAPAAPRDFAACSGCSLCFLVCPMWRSSRDPRFTPEGMAKALQCGATASQLSDVIDACSLCGACDPVCPEGIDLSGLVMHLRLRLAKDMPSRLPNAVMLEDLQLRLQQGAMSAGAKPAGLRSGPLLLPGPALRADPALLAQVQALLGLAIADDDGDDIALALELGVEIPQARLLEFVAALRGHSIVAADGLLLRQLRRWLPGSKRMGLGAALSSRPAVRSNLRADDLYVIEPRAFHGDYERMVEYYNQLQMETGCCLSLDLQRVAVPVTAPGVLQKLGIGVGDDGAQARWILHGREPARIVVEDLADRAAFQRVCELPVMYLAELGEDPEMIKRNPHAFG
jgi:NAD-dependent dihydropyrimidine dehydrogenase PreA subunit